MLAGSSVRTPWPGKVVAVTPWYGPEYGVTVLLPNGMEVTFGHLSPSVRTGQTLSRGDEVGRVVVDHVDVKVRDGHGYVDFGLRKIALAGSPTAALEPPAEGVAAAQRQAAAEAYRRYTEELAELAEEEAQVRLGLLPSGNPERRRERLEGLRPLARLHAQLHGKRLPAKRSSQEAVASSARPITDMLLGLPSVQSERSSTP
jgi:hypothetical protein